MDRGVDRLETIERRVSVRRRPDVFDVIQIFLQAVPLAILVRARIVPSVFGRGSFPESISAYLAEQLPVLTGIPV